jgi:hypothetical protein
MTGLLSPAKTTTIKAVQKTPGQIFAVVYEK